MAIKMTGAEWKKFYDDQTVWKGGAYHDDSCILVNGVNVDDDENIEIDKVDDNAVVEIECGLFYESEKVRDPVDLLPVIRYCLGSDSQGQKGRFGASFGRFWRKNPVIARILDRFL